MKVPDVALLQNPSGQVSQQGQPTNAMMAQKAATCCTSNLVRKQQVKLLVILSFFPNDVS
jgi:hypothetical protein